MPAIECETNLRFNPFSAHASDFLQRKREKKKEKGRKLHRFFHCLRNNGIENVRHRYRRISVKLLRR